MIVRGGFVIGEGLDWRWWWFWISFLREGFKSGFCIGGGVGDIYTSILYVVGGAEMENRDVVVRRGISTDSLVTNFVAVNAVACILIRAQ